MKNLYQKLLSISVFFLFTASVSAQVGTDNAGNYTTWTNGSNQGIGFGAWDLWVDHADQTSTFAGHFLGSSTPSHGDINTSGHAFGMYANPPSSPAPQANAQRSFNYTDGGSTYTELQDGHTFSIDLAVAYRNGYKGIDIMLSDFTQVFNFNVQSDMYLADGVDLGWTYDQYSIINIQVTQVSGTGVIVDLTRGSDTWADTITTTGRVGHFKCYIGNTNGGGAAENNLFFNNLAIHTSPPVPLVQVTPAIPNTNETVTIDFNASGTPLAGAAKVYLHSGVSLTESSPTSFDRVIGNWGQDDGVGEMTSVGTDLWQITLPSLRTYYGVDETEDIFGLNFLFRSADGSAQEDAGGNNFYNDVETGVYFILSEPAYSPALVEKNTAQPIEASSDNSADWTLTEVDANGNFISTLDQSTGSTTYSSSYTPTDLNVHYLKLEADIGGTVRYKTFQIKGYDPVVEAPRPGAMDPGIHYDPNDPTKATLILHAPTYTRYLKGTGASPCMPDPCSNTTTPKNVVFVVGDFNNWEVSEAYKMNRDRDGWDGTTDADADGDRGDYWWITLDNLTPGQEYVFQYLIDGQLQVADPYTHKVSDIEDSQIPASVYPNLISYPAAAQDRASVLQTDQEEYQWEVNDFVRPNPDDLIIYELHFRDFTEEGTYLAAIDKLDYIKNLGINSIHVMPVSEFEGNSSWGYNPNFYFAADKAYGTANDLKKFIDEAHKRGIAVFNDLVLNHAFYSNVMARMYWNEVDNQPADDNPWFNPTHKMVRNMAGWWGADWNHESEHVQKMVDRALDYWLQEFRFDGFRFDFTKGIGQTDPNDFPIGDDWASSYNRDRIDLLFRIVNGMWNRNPGSIAIFEHLANAAEDKVFADAGILLWSGVGHHNQVKNFMLGWSSDDINIYSSGVYNSSSLNYSEPSLISYAESHDEQRLAYEVMNYAKHVKDQTDPTLKLEMTVDRLKAAALNWVLPGPRMIWEFQELGYDYDIDFNGRTGEKPVAFTLGYDQDPLRLELRQLMAQVFEARNQYNWDWSSINYTNLGNSADYTTPRRISITDNQGHHLIVISNHDADNIHDANPGYAVTGTWYRNDGDLTNDTYTVNSTGDVYSLQPGQTLVLTNFELTVPNYTDTDGDGIYDTDDTCPNEAGIYELDGCPACAGDNWVTPASTIASGEYKYALTIESAGQVETGSQVSFSAGQTITLLPGFHAEVGADFHAFIEPCEVTSMLSEAPVSERTDKLEQSALNITNNKVVKTELTVFPNPAANNLNIRFYSTDSDKVDLYLMDTQGRLVKRLLENWHINKENEYSLQVSADNLAPGLYFLNYKSKTGIIVEKVSIIK